MKFLSDEAVMQHAISIARHGIGFVEPNPAVGAVIVDDHGHLIADGFHQKCGEPHAEVNAIKNAGEQTVGNRLFVTLEPCSHQGRTPPCTDSVIRAGFLEVVIGCEDPAAHTDGRGIRALRDAGLEVSVGLCRQDASELIAPFTMLQTQRRPWVHAKWAMTLDGRIATRTGHSQWISNAQSRRIVHQLRGRMDGVLVGSGTVRADNPTLTARPSGCRTATRIILDSRGVCLTQDSRLLATISDGPILVVTGPDQDAAACGMLTNAGVEVLKLPAAGEDSIRPCVPSLLKVLGDRQITNLLVEGGADTLGSFFDAELIDEVHVFVAPKLTGGAASRGPLHGTGREQMPELSDLTTTTVRRVIDDTYINGRIRRPGN